MKIKFPIFDKREDEISEFQGILLVVFAFVAAVAFCAFIATTIVVMKWWSIPFWLTILTALAFQQKMITIDFGTKTEK